MEPPTVRHALRSSGMGARGYLRLLDCGNSLDHSRDFCGFSISVHPFPLSISNRVQEFTDRDCGGRRSSFIHIRTVESGAQ